MRVQEAIEKFLFGCRAGGKSRHTASSDRCNLGRFASYLGTRGLPADIEQITIDDLRWYVVYL